LCFSCHQWYGSNPVESAEWVQDYLGGEALEELRQRKETICKRTKGEKKEIAAHWRAQTKYLQRCRQEGKEFVTTEWD
jgi:ribosome-binding ATPase YchF (GTP1/OBG family)